MRKNLECLQDYGIECPSTKSVFSLKTGEIVTWYIEHLLYLVIMLSIPVIHLACFTLLAILQQDHRGVPNTDQ